MSLVALIKPYFDTALKDYEHIVSINKITYVYYNLKYTIGTLNLLVYIELMDSYFSIEIKVSKNGKMYSISDIDRGSDPVFIGNGITYLNIFNFTSLKEEEFKLEKDELFKKKRKFFVWKKYVVKLAALYANLISSSLDNILAWASE